MQFYWRRPVTRSFFLVVFVHIIRKSTRSIGAMKYMPKYISFLILVRVSSGLFMLWQRPTSTPLSSTTLSFCPSPKVLSAMYRFQTLLSDYRSLIPALKRSIRRFHCLGSAPCLLMMLMDCAISQMPCLSLLSIRCVVQPPLSCQIPMVSAALGLTPTLAFSAQARTCRVSIWIVSASASTDFGNQKASHFIFGSQRWLMMECWISDTC